MTTNQTPIQEQPGAAGATEEKKGAFDAVEQAFSTPDFSFQKPAAPPTMEPPPPAEGAEGPSDQTNSQTQTTEPPASNQEPGKDDSKPADPLKTDETVPPVVEFTPEDIQMPAGTEGAAAEDTPEGTWLHVGKQLGLDIKEDTVEAYNEAVIAPYKKQVEEARALSFEKHLETMKPETSAAIKLMEMGYSPEKFYEIKKGIQTSLAMEDSTLMRAYYEDLARTNKDLTEAVIDYKMELLTGDPTKLKVAADSVRIELRESDAKLDNQKNQLIQQYETRTREAAEQRRREEVTNFKKALDTADSFMGIPLSPAVKEQVFKKFSVGGYDALRQDPSLFVESVLYRELGSKYQAALKNTAFEQGRDEKTKKQANIPPIQTGGGGTVGNQGQRSNWDAAEKAFGPTVA